MNKRMGFLPSAAVFVLAWFVIGLITSVLMQHPAGFFVSLAFSGVVTWYIRRRYARGHIEESRDH